MSRSRLVAVVLAIALAGSCTGGDLRTEVAISNQTGLRIESLTMFVDEHPTVQLRDVESSPHGLLTRGIDITSGPHEFEIVVDGASPTRFVGTISASEKTWIHLIIWSPDDVEARILSSAPGID